jgi:hypothetical protein
MLHREKLFVLRFTLLTYSMEQSPWEANQSLQLVKKFPALLWNPKDLHGTNKYSVLAK